MPDPDAAPGSPTILNVDDTEANRYAVTRLLRRAGFRVIEAANGLDALRQVGERPDLIILDVNLPDLDGFEVCRRIKADPGTESIPVLHMSASYVLSEDRIRGLDEGADGYLVRPVEPPELIATVRALLRVRSAERIARAAAHHWQATFDAIGDGVLLLDAENRVVRSNRAAGSIFGRPPARLVGRPIVELVDRPEAGADRSIGERWFRVGLDPIPNDDGSGGAVCTLADITERRRLADELRDRADALAEADRRKDEFLAMLAHELRNPLAPVLNAFEVLRLEGASADDARSARQVGERQVRHLARLVDDLLDVSRITTAKIQLRREAVDLAEVARRVVAAIRPTIEGHGHRLRVTIADAPLITFGDPTRLDQVLTNLLNNAAKYTEAGGQIRLSLGRSDQTAEIRVVDDGIGIPAEMLPRVFDLFTQVDRALDRSQGGLGIGLTLVRRLVELHGGTVEASSAGPNQGSTFVVRLPLDPAGPTPGVAGPTRSAAPGIAPAAGPRRLLIVDDQADAAMMLARLLRASGFDSRAANRGQDAIDAAADPRPDHRPDAIFLDIGLPGQDGYQVARAIRAAETPDAPPLLLIALTGYGQERDIRRARDAGFDHHLIKPTDLDSILALLDRAGLTRPAR